MSDVELNLNKEEIEIEENDSLLKGISQAPSVVEKKGKTLYESLVREYIKNNDVLLNHIKEAIDSLVGDEHTIQRDIFPDIPEFNEYLTSKGISDKKFNKLRKLLLSIIKSELEEKGYLCVLYEDRFSKCVSVFKYQHDLNRCKVKILLFKISELLGILFCLWVLGMVIVFVPILFGIFAFLLIFCFVGTASLTSTTKSKPKNSGIYRKNVNYPGSKRRIR